MSNTYNAYKRWMNKCARLAPQVGIEWMEELVDIGEWNCTAVVRNLQTIARLKSVAEDMELQITLRQPQVSHDRPAGSEAVAW